MITNSLDFIVKNRHTPVLLKESLNGLNIFSSGTYIDGTFGRGGHSMEIFRNLSPKGRLIVFDRDPEAIKFARQSFLDDNVSILHSRFSNIYSYCKANMLLGKIDGILLDLGMSSPQLDNANRGFSFLRNGPLDMRMDSSRGQRAEEVLAQLNEKELSTIFKNFGEERYSFHIAKLIKKAITSGKQIRTTLDLANIINSRFKRTEKKNPATRVFQAIRIYVNEELLEIKKFLDSFYQVLSKNGRLAVITFNSLEDRIVKRSMASMVYKDNFLKELPIPNDKNIAMMKWVVKKERPQDSEVKLNIRSRSAILRIVEKL